MDLVTILPSKRSQIGESNFTYLRAFAWFGHVKKKNKTGYNWKARVRARSDAHDYRHFHTFLEKSAIDYAKGTKEFGPIGRSAENIVRRNLAQ